MTYSQYKSKMYAYAGHDMVHTPYGSIHTSFETTGFLIRACFNSWSYP